MIRVFYNPDGTIADILQPAPGHSLDECTEKTNYGLLEFDDMDIADLPKGKGTRDKLRGGKGESLRIDNTLETRDEAIRTLKDLLNTELDSATPDPIKALRLQRDIERLNKEIWKTRKKT